MLLAASLDPSYGQAGVVLNAVPNDFVVAEMLPLPRGAVMLVGHRGSNAPRDIVLAKFTAKGRPDAGFGTGGILQIDLGADERVSRAFVTSRGGVAVAGAWGAAVFRTDGSLDNGFADGGVLRSALLPESFRELPNGGYRAFRPAAGTEPEGVLALTAAGQPDPTQFGGDGFLPASDLRTLLDEPTMTFDKAGFGNDGRMVFAVGYLRELDPPYGPAAYEIAHVSPDGSTGSWNGQLPSPYDSYYSLLQTVNDGSVVSYLETVDSNHPYPGNETGEFVIPPLPRYLNIPDGCECSPYFQVNDFWVGSDGLIYQAGMVGYPFSTIGGYDAYVMRFDVSGAYDRSFGLGGIALLDVGSLAGSGGGYDSFSRIITDSTGQIVGFGRTSVDGQDEVPFLAKLDTPWRGPIASLALSQPASPFADFRASERSSLARLDDLGLE